MHRLIAIAIVLATAAPAHAEDRVRAEQYYRLGEKAYQAQNFRAAAENFEEAFKTFELPEIAFSAAQAYRRLYRIEPLPEHVQRAVDLYTFYIEKVKVGGRMADAVDAKAEMKAELDKIIASGVKVSPALAKEYTRIVINPSLGKAPTSHGMEEVKEGRSEDVAMITLLDGKRVDAFAPINVTPAKYKVVVTAAGYFPGEKEAQATQGATTIVDVELEPKPAKVSIDSEAGAHVSIDGRPAGSAPLAAFEVAAGRHIVTLSMRGHEPIAREVVVERGQSITLREPLRTTARRRLVPYFLGAGAVATAVFGVSTTFALIRDDEGSDLLHDLRYTGGWSLADEDRYNRVRESRDRWQIMGIVSGAALVGLASTAAVLYFTDNPSPDRVRIEPMALSRGGGAAIAGGF